MEKLYDIQLKLKFLAVNQIMDEKTLKVIFVAATYFSQYFRLSYLRFFLTAVSSYIKLCVPKGKSMKHQHEKSELYCP